LKCDDQINTVSRPRAWFALFRLPNLLTVPGDPAAGVLLAAGAYGMTVDWARAWPCLAAALCLYMAGLVSNDYFDRDLDAMERPERPIPSGLIRPAAALAVGLILTVAGLALAACAGRLALLIAALLAMSVWAYNIRLKHVPVLGPLAMGLCRGLSLLMGASVLGSEALFRTPVLLAAGGLLLYIAAVTMIARLETASANPANKAGRIGLLLWMPPFAIWMMLAALILGGFAIPLRPSGFTYMLAGMAAVWPAIWCGLLMGTPTPSSVGQSIGALIRGLILVQAALCAMAGHPGDLPGLCLLAAFPLASWLGRCFAGS